MCDPSARHFPEWFDARHPTIQSKSPCDSHWLWLQNSERAHGSGRNTAQRATRMIGRNSAQGRTWSRYTETAATKRRPAATAAAQPNRVRRCAGTRRGAAAPCIASASVSMPSKAPCFVTRDLNTVTVCYKAAKVTGDPRTPRVATELRSLSSKLNSFHAGQNGRRHVVIIRR